MPFIILLKVWIIQKFWILEATFDWPNAINNANDDWVLANVQQFGYYRVNYQESNWKALIKQLTRNYTVIII